MTPSVNVAVREDGALLWSCTCPVEQWAQSEALADFEPPPPPSGPKPAPYYRQYERTRRTR